MNAQIDAPGTVCAFESHHCTNMVLGRGGLDEHHEHPLSLGGAESGPKLALCPLHHRRQHSLIRYLVETLDQKTADWDVLKHFSPAERQAAADAVSAWVAAGRPLIASWPCPAARP